MSTDLPIITREARPSELAAIQMLTRSAYEQYATIMTPSAWQGLRSAVEGAFATPTVAQHIVAERAGELLGSVLLFPPDSDAYGSAGPRMPCPEIRLLAVAPVARGFGVGKLLVAECVRRARASGATRIGLHTSPSMQNAIQLYERAGFGRDPKGDIHITGAEAIEAYQLVLPPSWSPS
jgi:GNAT superfamily N-acetyltransferase